MNAFIDQCDRKNMKEQRNLSTLRTVYGEITFFSLRFRHIHYCETNLKTSANVETMLNQTVFIIVHNQQLSVLITFLV